MTNILECSIVFVKRLANRVAYLLARAAGSMPEIEELDLPPLELLRDVLLYDMTK